MAYQPKSYRKFVATTATAAMVASAVAPVVSAAGFTDVAPQYKDAIDFLVSTGATNGKTETQFGVYDEITRLDAAVILAKVLKLDVDNAKDAGFTDVPKDRAKYVNALVDAGILNGKSETRFGAYDKLTRVEMAKIIANAYNLKGDDVTLPFTDVNDTWAPYVKALYKNGVAKGKTETKFGAYENITRGDFARFVYNAHNATVAPEVISVSAVNSTQAVVTFSTEIGEVSATNFTVDNGLAVVNAEINPNNKKQVTLTFNQPLADKTTYKVTANGVKSVAGVELKEDSSAEFTYEIGEVSKIELTKTTFVNGDDITDFVKLTNDKGIDVTDEYTVEISSTSQKINNGTVSGVTTSEVAYVQVTVKSKSGNTVVKQSDAIKVTLSPIAVTSLVGFGLGNDVDNPTAFKQAVQNGQLISEMKKSSRPNLELLVKDNNGNEKLLSANDVTKIENLTPTVAVVSKDNNTGELVVDAYSTGTAQVKLTIGDFVTTVSFTVKEDSKIANATLSKSNVYFNTANDDKAENDSVNVNIVDQYGEKIQATVTSNEVFVGKNKVGTLTAKSSNTNVATVTVNNVTQPSSSLPIRITEAGKGTATITVEFKDTKGNVVFTKTLTVTGKDAGAFAGYVIETDATEIDLDKDVNLEPNDDTVNFTVYEVDAQGNKIQPVTSGVTLEIQGYDKNPEVKQYIDVDQNNPLAITVVNSNAYKTFAGSGTLNVDVKVNGTKIGTKTITYKNTDPVATKAVINTVDVVIDNDKINGFTDQPLALLDLFYGHYDSKAGKYTIAPKLSVLDQSSKVIDWDTNQPGTLVNTDSVNNIVFTTTNESNVEISNGQATLASRKSSGSFTVVVSDVDTTAVADILPAPVAFKVTIVD
ncbi:S-layer homology domain-containing protein [Parageobacillus thermantarcticus]|uniref:S-layer homology domain-containing protein n=1 Tax=Parageobacillus thermantarcticus TaxID=186116 RepID=A0A1I0TLD6_9BACL|nr:S-layer homology domain-containing protein [Parageobacillus thermantarcticus]SFA52589.1 S-layer homology domain-containing protein [Parageobacillus thermantarcticus]